MKQLIKSLCKRRLTGLFSTTMMISPRTILPANPLVVGFSPSLAIDFHSLSWIKYDRWSRSFQSQRIPYHQLHVWNHQYFLQRMYVFLIIHVWNTTHEVMHVMWNEYYICNKYKVIVNVNSYSIYVLSYIMYPLLYINNWFFFKSSHKIYTVLSFYWEVILPK